jgi:hypothetical protein
MTTSNFPTFTSSGIQFNGSVPNILSASGYSSTSFLLTCFVVYKSTLNNVRQRYFKCAQKNTWGYWIGDTTHITMGQGFNPLSIYGALQAPQYSMVADVDIRYTPNATTVISGFSNSKDYQATTNPVWSVNGTESFTWASKPIKTGGGMSNTLLYGNDDASSWRRVGRVLYRIHHGDSHVRHNLYRSPAPASRIVLGLEMGSEYEFTHITLW